MDTLLVQQEPFITSLSQQGNIMNNSKLISISLVLALGFVYFCILLLAGVAWSIIAGVHINMYDALALSLVGAASFTAGYSFRHTKLFEKNG
jgi:hypothetical protein